MEVYKVSLHKLFIRYKQKNYIFTVENLTGNCLMNESFHELPGMGEAFPCGTVAKNPPANAEDTGDAGLILG